MAYLVFRAGEEELDRRELLDPVIIGRSPECAISIRDIGLSRKHCQIVRTETGWAIEDLSSKNGTFVLGHRFPKHELVDGLVVRIGKTRLTFHAGAFVPAPKRVSSRARPADPVVDVSAGTVMGFVLDDQPVPMNSQIRFPRPQPRPSEPAAYENDAVHSLVSDLVSSSWDSIYESASRPVKPAHLLPKPVVRALPSKPRRSRRPEFPTALQLNVVAPEPQVLSPVLAPVEPEAEPRPMLRVSSRPMGFRRLLNHAGRRIARKVSSVIVSIPLHVARIEEEAGSSRRAA